MTPPLGQFDRLFIGGEWVRSASGGAIASIDPSTEEVWTDVATADAVITGARREVGAIVREPDTTVESLSALGFRLVAIARIGSVVPPRHFSRR